MAQRDQSVMPLLFRSVSDQLYNYALSSAYRSHWVYDPSLPLLKDPDIWEVVRRDPVIMSAMERRERGVVRQWRVEPARGSRKPPDKTVAAIIEEGLGFIDRFDASRRRIAEAAFLGRTYGFIEGGFRRCSLGDTIEMDWWVPTRIHDIDRRRIRYFVDWRTTMEGDRIKSTHIEVFDTNKATFVRPSDAWREALIEYIYGDTEDRVGYGRGLLEATYFYHYMKTSTMTKILEGI